jgi:hypothetical protein
MMIHASCSLVVAVFTLCLATVSATAQQTPPTPARQSVKSGIITRTLDDATKNPTAVTRLDLSRQRLKELPEAVLTLENLE